MSNHLVSEVYKRRVGKMARVAVLALMADKASDDGSGIWASKQTFADELGCTRQTVIDTIGALIGDGLVQEVGQRVCPNGYTTEYQIDVAVLEALPLVASHQRKEDAKTRPAPVKNIDGSKILTGQKSGRVKNIDPTCQKSGPHPSKILTQTPLEPLLNQSPLAPRRGGRSVRAAIPENWDCPKITDLTAQIRTLAEQWPAGAYETEAEAFHQHWRGRQHRRADWDALWASRVADRHIDVMRAAKAGVSYLATPGATGAAAGYAPAAPKLPAAAKTDEDDRSAALHVALRDLVGDMLWRQWFECTALIIADDALTILAPSQFASQWIDEHLRSQINQAIANLGWNIEHIYHRVSAPRRRKSGEKA